jgi:hypothetical protein
MNIRNHQDSLLARISSGITANAAQLQRLDLARLGRGAEAACKFQDVLADLKERIERRAALRAQSAFAIDGIALPSMAA